MKHPQPSLPNQTTRISITLISNLENLQSLNVNLGISFHFIFLKKRISFTVADDPVDPIHANSHDIKKIRFINITSTMIAPMDIILPANAYTNKHFLLKCSDAMHAFGSSMIAKTPTSCFILIYSFIRSLSSN